MSKIEVIEFLREKLAMVETTLRAREQASECWAGGSDESWVAASLLHPIHKRQSLQQAGPFE